MVPLTNSLEYTRGTPYGELLVHLDEHVGQYNDWLISTGRGESTRTQYVGLVKGMMRKCDIRDEDTWDQLLVNYTLSSRGVRKAARNSYMQFLGGPPVVARSAAEKVSVVTGRTGKEKVLFNLKKWADKYTEMYEAGLFEDSVVTVVDRFMMDYTGTAVMLVHVEEEKVLKVSNEQLTAVPPSKDELGELLNRLKGSMAGRAGIRVSVADPQPVDDDFELPEEDDIMVSDVSDDEDAEDLESDD